MRQSRAQSRGSSRQSASSPNPSLGSTLVKRSMKLPQIAGVSDDISSINNSNGQGNSGLVVGVCSQQGKRPYQEDEYSIRQFLNQSSPASENETNVETHFFGLFDGHAGGRCSNYVAGSLPNVLAEDSSFFTNLPQALKRSFHQTNEMFLKVAEKMKYHDGSTGITAVVRDSKVLVANVGDCRCLIISGGRPIQMSIDQKPTNPEEQKRIVALGGTVVYCMGVARVNRVLAVSRAFGNRTLRSVIRPDAEMMQRELTKDDDFLVMASDGLWDVLKNKDVCDMCYSPFSQGSPQVIADELVQAALMRGSMDNVTCIVVRLTDYVKRLFSGGIGGRQQHSGSNTGTASSTSFGATGAPYASSNGSTRAGVVGRDGETLERSSSLKNVPGSNTSQRLNGSDNSAASGNNNNNSSIGSGSATIPMPMTRQYSTGSISATANSGRHELSALQHPSTTQLAPMLDNNYLYSPNTRNRGSSGAGAESPSFLPSSIGPPSPGIASLRQHMNRDGSFNLDEEDQLNVSQNSSSNTPAWMSQQVNSTSGSGYGHNGAAAVPYAARRPTSMSGGAGNILNNSSRASFTSNAPSLISMFNNTVPQGGPGQGSAAANGGLVPISAGNSPKGSGSGSHSGLWNSESDYSGSSQLDNSGSGSGSRYGHGSYTQKPSSLATMFPINYKRPPSKK